MKKLIAFFGTTTILASAISAPIAVLNSQIPVNLDLSDNKWNKLITSRLEKMISNKQAIVFNVKEFKNITKEMLTNKLIAVLGLPLKNFVSLEISDISNIVFNNGTFKNGTVTFKIFDKNTNQFLKVVDQNTFKFEFTTSDILAYQQNAQKNWDTLDQVLNFKGEKAVNFSAKDATLQPFSQSITLLKNLILDKVNGSTSLQPSAKNSIISIINNLDDFLNTSLAPLLDAITNLWSLGHDAFNLAYVFLPHKMSDLIDSNNQIKTEKLNLIENLINKGLSRLAIKPINWHNSFNKEFNIDLGLGSSSWIKINIHSYNDLLISLLPDLIHFFNYLFVNDNNYMNPALTIIKYLALPKASIKNDDFNNVNISYQNKDKDLNLFSNLENILFDLIGYSNEDKSITGWTYQNYTNQPGFLIKTDLLDSENPNLSYKDLLSLFPTIFQLVLKLDANNLTELYESFVEHILSPKSLANVNLGLDFFSIPGFDSRPIWEDALKFYLQQNNVDYKLYNFNILDSLASDQDGMDGNKVSGKPHANLQAYDISKKTWFTVDFSPTNSNESISFAQLFNPNVTNIREIATFDLKVTQIMNNKIARVYQNVNLIMPLSI